MIPRIVHQIWLGPRERPEWAMQTWREKHPGWEYRLWTEQSLREEWPNGLHNQEQFDEIGELCGKADIARYEVLHRFGGLYADADSVCLRPLDDALLENDSFSCYENEWMRGNLVASGFLATSRENELARLLADGLHDRRGEALWRGPGTAWMTVGPRYVTEMIHQCRYTRIAIYPSFFFVPRHYRGIGYTGPARGYATHWWESTTGVRPEPQTAGLTPASGDSSARLWEQAAAAKCEAVRVRDMDFLVRPGACDRAVLAEVVEHDCYRLLEWSPLRPPQRILDLGANIGVFTAWAARCFPAARVVGYEPDPEQAAVAQRNTQTLGNAAIVAASAVRLGGNSLATILGDQGADRVDLLKIDCAGAEWSLLEEAGADSLGRVDALAMELYCNGLAGRTPERMAGHLRRFFREVRIDRARLPVSCLVFASVPTAPR